MRVRVGIVDGRIGIRMSAVGMRRVTFVKSGEILVVGDGGIVELSRTVELMRRILFVAVGRMRTLSLSWLRSKRVN